ncbi:hypothetical protein GJ632_08670 [Halogeometricum sp. CBA1124]|nr:hypothetical protein [Halogeometricum sp. CBA1124]
MTGIEQTAMNTEGEDANWDPDRLLRRLQAMDDYEFEHLVGDLWEQQGWNTEVEQQSSDAGVDVRATQTSPYRRKVLIQAKRYGDKNPVSGPAVQQYAALKQQEPDTDESIIVTTGRFTGSAEDRAKELNVKLIDGEALVDLIDRLGAYNVVESYIGPPISRETEDEKRDGDRERDDGVEGAAVRRLTSEERTLVEDVAGKGLEECIRDEEYRATRAMERARAVTRLNPHDAKLLGIFDGAPRYDFEREFDEKKMVLVFLKEDVHVNDDGEVYVEDLTDYIKASAIDCNASEGVVGTIERGVKDGAWLSAEGEEYWETQQQFRRFKKKGKDVLSSVFDGEDSTSLDAPSNRRTAANSDAESADVTSQMESSRDVPTSSDKVRTNAQETSSNRSDEVASATDQFSEQGTETQHNAGSNGEPPALDLARSKWFYGVAVATAGWAFVWLLTISNVAAPVIGLTSLVSWPLLPAAMLMDTRKTGKLERTRTRSLVYIVSSMVPLLAVVPGGVYLYRRENSWAR